MARHPRLHVEARPVISSRLKAQEDKPDLSRISDSEQFPQCYQTVEGGIILLRISDLPLASRLLSMAACEAANRATGTLYGEQLT